MLNSSDFCCLALVLAETATTGDIGSLAQLAVTTLPKCPTRTARQQRTSDTRRARWLQFGRFASCHNRIQRLRGKTRVERAMEKLFTKIGAPSYLPTPTEVLDGVRWLRENPAIAAGVVVGLTSYSVAKYYEYGMDSDDSDEDNDENAEDGARATREEIARSVTALHLGLLKANTPKKDRRHSAGSSASTESSLASSGGLRSRASSIFDKAYHEELHFQEHAVEQVWSCLHEGECPPGEQCSDPVWGWFVPAANASPTHKP